MGNGAKKYIKKIKQLINWVEEEQFENILEASKILTKNDLGFRLYSFFNFNS